MDFLEGLNESYDLKYEEISETGDPIFIIKDIDNNEEHRFYPNDLVEIMNMLNMIEKHPNIDHGKSLNESYNIYHYGLSDGIESTIVLEDIDNDFKHTFYPEDINKIRNFLNRLKEFNVI